MASVAKVYLILSKYQKSDWPRTHPSSIPMPYDRLMYYCISLAVHPYVVVAKLKTQFLCIVAMGDLPHILKKCIKLIKHAAELAHLDRTIVVRLLYKSEPTKQFNTLPPHYML